MTSRDAVRPWKAHTWQWVASDGNYFEEDNKYIQKFGQ
jgi:hypothetical protein